MDGASNWRDLIKEDFGVDDGDFGEDDVILIKANVPAGCCHWQKIDGEFESIWNDTISDEENKLDPKVRVNCLRNVFSLSPGMHAN